MLNRTFVRAYSYNLDFFNNIKVIMESCYTHEQIESSVTLFTIRSKINKYYDNLLLKHALKNPFNYKHWISYFEFRSAMKEMNEHLKVYVEAYLEALNEGQEEQNNRIVVTGFQPQTNDEIGEYEV